jgi:hypothetical protein
MRATANTRSPARFPSVYRSRRVPFHHPPKRPKPRHAIEKRKSNPPRHSPRLSCRTKPPAKTTVTECYNPLQLFNAHFVRAQPRTTFSAAYLFLASWLLGFLATRRLSLPQRAKPRQSAPTSRAPAQIEPTATPFPLPFAFYLLPSLPTPQPTAPPEVLPCT